MASWNDGRRKSRRLVSRTNVESSYGLRRHEDIRTSWCLAAFISHRWAALPQKMIFLWYHRKIGAVQELEKGRFEGGWASF
jgi:hypothetical protein